MNEQMNNELMNTMNKSPSAPTNLIGPGRNRAIV